MQLWFDAGIAIAAQPAVEAKGSRERKPPARGGAVGADDEWKRAKEPGRDARHRAPFEDALASAAQACGLQRAQAAVDGLLVVEGGAAAEVASFDERRAQASAGGLVSDREAVDAAADHQHVVCRRREAREVA